MAIDEKQNDLTTTSLESSGISSPAEYDDLPDVDAGKTDAERAQLVRPALFRSASSLLY
jgi:hypothetical protein